MPYRNDKGRFLLVAVQHDITAVAEVDHPFAVFRLHLIGWPSNFWMLTENLNPGSDRLHRTTRSIDIFYGKKTVQPFHVK